uniref:Uncharacterized protein n=1 Tax=Theileria parva TaxID=5875 RepID=Q4N802_THEPA
MESKEDLEDKSSMFKGFSKVKSEVECEDSTEGIL